MSKQSILLYILLGFSLLSLLVLSCDQRIFFLLLICTALELPLALMIVSIYRRRKTHPVPYMWLARIWCVSIIASPVIIVLAAIHWGIVGGFAVGLRTFLIGCIQFTVLYGLFSAMGGHKVFRQLFKIANWSGTVG